jgi:hypothetical protein
MDALALLLRARDVGLRVEAAGGKLTVRGPKRAEAVVRLLAEHKAEVLAALTPRPAGATEAAYWKERFTARTFEWLRAERGWEAAKRLAWGDLQNEWHALHGRRWPNWQCAGCDGAISGRRALDLPDGNRVHLEPIDCLINFGRRWRDAANTGLGALGLERRQTSHRMPARTLSQAQNSESE